MWELRNYRRTYQVEKPLITQVAWYYTNALIINSALFPFNRLKVLILRWFGAEVGRGVIIKPSVNIKYPWKLVLSDFVWIGEGVWIDNLDLVEIGHDSIVSQGALLITGNHNYKSADFELFTKAIVIESNVWVTSKTIVLPGAVITAGTVTKPGQTYLHQRKR